MQQTAQKSPSSEPLPERWAAFAVLLTANFMNLIDVTIVNVALPTMRSELTASPNQIEWIVAGYIFVFALLLLPSGRAGDLFGRRRMFLAGVTVFTTASATCGFAPNIEWLIGSRLVQGMGGAMMVPQTLALVPFLFPPRERGGVFGLFALAAGLASVAGPILGGLLIGADIYGLTWRPIFLVNVPIGILTVFLALRLVPPVPGHRRLGIDFVGILIAAATLLAVLFPLIEGPVVGWSAWMVGLLVAFPFLFAAFILWQRRQEKNSAPQLLPFTLIGKKSFLSGALLSSMLFSGIPSFFLIVAIYLQSGFGLTPLQSGLTTVPFSLGVVFASPVSSRLGSSHLRLRVILGALLLAGSMAVMHIVVLAMTDQIHWLWTSPVFLCAGFGLGTAVSPLFQIALSGATGSDSGSASGAVQSFQQVGSAFGVAIVGGIFFSTLGNAAPGDHAAYTQALTAALWYSITVFVLIAAIALLARIAPDPSEEEDYEAEHESPPQLAEV